jgi:hypothetical protein
MKRSKKKARNLRRRIADYEEMVQRQASDIIRKHPQGYHRPGSNSK